MLPKAIIVDLDGTLANIDHRLKYIQQTPKDWDAFYGAMEDDIYNDWCYELTYRFSTMDILFITGRPEKWKEKTHEWLRILALGSCYLFMRSEGDNRPDNIIKQEIYEREIKDKFDVLFVLEDRQRCVDMWRSLGLVCLQCAKGDY